MLAFSNGAALGHRLTSYFGPLPSLSDIWLSLCGHHVPLYTYRLRSLNTFLAFVISHTSINRYEENSFPTNKNMELYNRYYCCMVRLCTVWFRLKDHCYFEHSLHTYKLWSHHIEANTFVNLRARALSSTFVRVRAGSSSTTELSPRRMPRAQSTRMSHI